MSHRSCFSERLATAVRQRGTPLVVGLDPRVDQLPEPLRPESRQAAVLAAAVRKYCCQLIDVVASLVPAVKPQLAFFELLGPEGMSALQAVIQHAQDAGLLVLLDGKRNDIGSTAEAYAAAYLGQQSIWQGDALTVSPYLGDDTLTPFATAARNHHAGIFVLVKTSNPGSGTLQDQFVDGRPLHDRVAEIVEHLAADSVDSSGYGQIGAVVGATYPEQLSRLRQLMPHAWLLVPGLGAQGGAASDVAAAFDDNGLGAIVNSSRAIIFAYNREPFRTATPNDWQHAVEQAARQTIQELAEHTRAGRLR